jgi:hypothetical protein
LFLRIIFEIQTLAFQSIWLEVAILSCVIPVHMNTCVLKYNVVLFPEGRGPKAPHTPQRPYLELGPPGRAQSSMVPPFLSFDSWSPQLMKLCWVDEGSNSM